MAYNQETIRALYRKLLALYPRAFRERVGESMEQTFNDLCNERRRRAGRGSFGFLLWAFLETAAGAGREHARFVTQGGAMKTITTNPGAAAFVGLLFVTPLVLLNKIVGDRVEPFFSLIRPGAHTSTLEYVLLPAVLLLLPVGAFIALRPMLRREAGAGRKLYPVNCALAALLLGGFVLISLAWGAEIYRCDILQIPNCD
jgi:hypothetical protein